MTSDQITLVTGGASGIGLAAAKALLAAGHRVIIADRSPENLEKCSALDVSYPGRTTCLELDVTQENAVVDCIARIEEEVGPLSGLVNSAGVGTITSFFDTSTDLFRRMFEINVIGSFVVAREAAKRMRTRRAGAIVNIASVAGIRGSVGRVAYGASKGGVIAMTNIMAAELVTHGIRTNAIAPGPVDTPLRQTNGKTWDQWIGPWMPHLPMRRPGKPEEIAGAAVFLLDDRQSGYVNGQTICIDGGFVTSGVLDLA